MNKIFGIFMVMVILAASCAAVKANPSSDRYVGWGGWFEKDGVVLEISRDWLAGSEGTELEKANADIFSSLLEELKRDGWVWNPNREEKKLNYYEVRLYHSEPGFTNRGVYHLYISRSIEWRDVTIFNVYGSPPAIDPRKVVSIIRDDLTQFTWSTPFQYFQHKLDGRKGLILSAVKSRQNDFIALESQLQKKWALTEYAPIGAVCQVVLKEDSTSLTLCKGTVGDFGSVSYADNWILEKTFSWEGGDQPSTSRVAELIEFITAGNREAGKILLEKASWAGMPFQKIEVFEKKASGGILSTFLGYETLSGEKGLVNVCERP